MTWLAMTCQALGLGDYYLRDDMGQSANVIGAAVVLFIGLAIVASLLGAVRDFLQRARPAMVVINKMNAWFRGRPVHVDAKLTPG